MVPLFAHNRILQHIPEHSRRFQCNSTPIFSRSASLPTSTSTSSQHLVPALLPSRQCRQAASISTSITTPYVRQYTAPRKSSSSSSTATEVNSTAPVSPWRCPTSSASEDATGTKDGYEADLSEAEEVTGAKTPSRFLGLTQPSHEGPPPSPPPPPPALPSWTKPFIDAANLVKTHYPLETLTQAAGINGEVPNSTGSVFPPLDDGQTNIYDPSSGDFQLIASSTWHHSPPAHPLSSFNFTSPSSTSAPLLPPDTATLDPTSLINITPAPQHAMVRMSNALFEPPHLYAMRRQREAYDAAAFKKQDGAIQTSRRGKKKDYRRIATASLVEDSPVPSVERH
jgi:hypothetical protein